MELKAVQEAGDGSVEKDGSWSHSSTSPPGYTGYRARWLQSQAMQTQVQNSRLLIGDAVELSTGNCSKTTTYKSINLRWQHASSISHTLTHMQNIPFLTCDMKPAKAGCLSDFNMSVLTPEDIFLLRTVRGDQNYKGNKSAGLVPLTTSKGNLLVSARTPGTILFTCTLPWVQAEQTQVSGRHGGGGRWSLSMLACVYSCSQLYKARTVLFFRSWRKENGWWVFRFHLSVFCFIFTSHHNI